MQALEDVQEWLGVENEEYLHYLPRERERIFLRAKD